MPSQVWVHLCFHRQLKAGSSRAPRALASIFCGSSNKRSMTQDIALVGRQPNGIVMHRRLQEEPSRVRPVTVLDCSTKSLAIIIVLHAAVPNSVCFDSILYRMSVCVRSKTRVRSAPTTAIEYATPSSPRTRRFWTRTGAAESQKRHGMSHRFPPSARSNLTRECLRTQQLFRLRVRGLRRHGQLYRRHIAPR